MKHYSKISIIALISILSLTSCDTKNEDKSEHTTESVTIEKTDDQNTTENTENTDSETETLSAEGTAVAGDHSLDDMCLEKSISDCYIVNHFTEMDVEYITVDFVSYKLDEDSKHTDYEAYDLVNDNKKLRTFIVNTTYKSCGRDKDISINDLIKASEDNSETIFSLEAEEGVITELYIDTCSG